MNNIYTKIAEARVRFGEAKIKKTGENKFSHYFYFELSDILPTCLRICKELGLTPIISFSTDTATMTVVNNENPEEQIVITSPMDGAELKGCHEIQNTGARETYSRRYLWFSLFEITEPDALDSTQGSDNGYKPQKNEAKAPPKKRENTNSSKEAVPQTGKLFNPSQVWIDVCKYFGYSTQLSEEEKKIVQQSAHEFIDEFHIGAINDITPEISNKIYAKLQIDAKSHGLDINSFGIGPEGFKGDDL